MGDIIYKEVIFMELLEYIKKNYKTPNVAVLRTLGASEELIEYLINTPWNTNIKVVESLIEDKDGDSDKPSLQGIKSITITPAIETNPAITESVPLYWDGENKQLDVASGVFKAGVEYTITLTPTDGWYTQIGSDYFGGTNGNQGETISLKINPVRDFSVYNIYFIASDEPIGQTEPKVFTLVHLIGSN